MDPRRPLLLTLVAVLLGACGTTSPADEKPVNPAPTRPTTIPASTAAPRTTATTAAASPATTGAASSAASATPTSVPVASTAAAVGGATPGAGAGGVQLAVGGLGAVQFGAEADGAVAALTTALGPPNADSGWVAAASSPFGVCPGAEVRGVRWGPLQALFGDAAAGSRHLFSYVYATSMLPPGEVPGKAAGLQTAIGIGLGSSIADLKASYPSVSISDDAYGPTFATVSGSVPGLSGTLSSVGIDGFVTSIIGGTYCGE